MPLGTEGFAMHGQFLEDPGVIPFARSREGAPAASDQLDKAGQTILQLVAQAAGIADENSRHALGMAPSNGSIASTARLKSAFFNKALGARREALPNDRKIKGV